MFLGHFGLALAAKKLAPRTSLGTTVLATEFADMLWPVFLILGWEQVEIVPGITKITPLNFVSYPWSHSLLMDLFWAAAFAALYFVIRRYPTGAVIVGAGVVSHWLLDWVSHRPDMPITPWSTEKYGLGLWNSMGGTVAVELVLFFGGLAIYMRQTRARDKTGRIALWSFVTLLVLIWVGSTLGPPPPTVHAIKYSALSLWLTVAWGYWIDRQRELVKGGGPESSR
jgi:membrane-bound metal-dependent hydrolase YbcI (DUF457 family)